MTTNLTGKFLVYDAAAATWLAKDGSWIAEPQQARTFDTLAQARDAAHVAGGAAFGPVVKLKSDPEPMMTGADLAGDCEGEEIAALIDLAMSVRDANPAKPSGNLDTLRNRAIEILARIEARAK